MSRFGDDEWELGSIITSPGVATTKVNWTLITEGAWRLAAKELAFVQLHPKVSGGEAAWKPETVLALPSQAGRLARLCIDRGVHTPADLDQRIGERLVREALESGHPKSYIPSFQQAINLANARDFLTAAPPTHPFKGLSADMLLHRKRGENKTSRIPEPIWGTLLAWAERFVLEFAPEILAEWEWTREIQPSSHRSRDGLHLLPKYFAKLRTRGRGIPYRPIKYAGRVPDPRLARLAWRRLLLECGLSASGSKNRISRYAPVILEAVEALGYHHDVVRKQRPKSLEALLPDGFGGSGLITATRMLRIACAIVVCAYTGMRADEVWGLESGCCFTRPVPGTSRARYFLRGKVFKGEREPKAAEWVTIDVAAEAVRVTEQLWDEPGRLFVAARHRGRGKMTLLPVDMEAFREYANNVAKSEDELCQAETSDTDSAAAESIGNIPLTDQDGAYFRLNWMQFRRTLAWFIGMQPLGWAAGSWQFKHLGVELFSVGYHGTSASGFRQEVMAWDILRRIVDYEQLHDAVRSGETGLSGPAAPRLRASFNEPRKWKGDVITNPGRYLNLVRQEDMPLFPGALCDCLYDPSQALCQRRQAQVAEATVERVPNWASCAPADCANVVFRSKHRKPWEAHAQQARAQLEEPALTDVQRAQLRAQLKEDNRILYQIKKYEREIQGRESRT